MIIQIWGGGFVKTPIINEIVLDHHIRTIQTIKAYIVLSVIPANIGSLIKKASKCKQEYTQLKFYERMNFNTTDETMEHHLIQWDFD